MCSHETRAEKFGVSFVCMLYAGMQIRIKQRPKQSVDVTVYFHIKDRSIFLKEDIINNNHKY